MPKTCGDKRFPDAIFDVGDACFVVANDSDQLVQLPCQFTLFRVTFGTALVPRNIPAETFVILLHPTSGMVIR